MDFSERIHEDPIRDTALEVQRLLQVDDSKEANIHRLEQLYAQASIPLYRGSSMSMISTIVVILNICTTRGTSSTF
jgi:hypothetical protein